MQTVLDTQSHVAELQPKNMSVYHCVCVCVCLSLSVCAGLCWGEATQCSSHLQHDYLQRYCIFWNT